MAAISTKNSEVVVLGITMLSTKWTVEIRADEIDVTTFESNGFTDYITSYVDSNNSVDCFWDSQTNPFANPPGINVGRVIESTKLVIDRGGAAGSGATAENWFFFPYAVITHATTTAAVRDAVRYDFGFRNKGAFRYPGNITFVGETIFPLIGANQV